jgi:putative multiple sugar transport system permease protein
MSEVSTKTEKTESKPSLSINARDYGLLGALVIIVALFQFWFTHGKLLLPANFNNLISQNAYVVIIAIGMVMVIIAGHIDLSVGSLVAMIGAISAIAIKDWGAPVWLSILLSLLAGALVGAWQGFWVAFIRVPAFIVTLAGMLVFRGLAIVFLTGGTIGGLPSSYVAIGGRWVPSWLGNVGDLDVFTLLIGVLGAVGYVVSQLSARSKLKARNLPMESSTVFIVKSVLISAAMLFFSYLLASHEGTPWVLILLGVLILVYTFVLNRTVFGRHVYAMGGNRFAAMMSGVKTKWVDFFIFVNIGTLAAVAAIVTTSRAGAAQSAAGTWYELDAIAAVFIGGAAVSGGVGKISGAVIGALVMGVLNQGLSIMGVDSAWQQVIKGLVLLAAVAFDVMNRRRAGTA